MRAGRLIAELARQGRWSAGLDSSATAVALARRASAPVFLGSVFRPVPAEGLWDTVLLADGNVGIGGDPAALLRRCRDLLAPGGRLLVELRSGASGLRTGRVRLESGTESGHWFRWADVAEDAVGVPARAAGLRVHDTWQRAGRSFATLQVAGRGR